MAIGNIVLSENNLSQNGAIFNAATQLKPYNKLYLNMGSTSLAGKKIALSKLNVFYSWPNISTTNNTFSISWPTGAGAYSDFSITIPAYSNYSSVEDLNDYLKTILIANGLYIINTTSGDYLYYMSFVSNPNLYGVSLVQNLVPTSLPSGYSLPSNFISWPSVSRTMKFTTDTSDFNKLIGFAASTIFNGNTSAIVYNSTITAQLSPVSSVNITLNLANNPLSLNVDSTVIYTFTTKDTAYGSIINVEPINLVYYDITSSNNLLILSFTDQDGRALYIQDSQISALLLVSDT